jgi:hypothetical protein
LLIPFREVSAAGRCDGGDHVNLETTVWMKGCSRNFMKGCGSRQ